MFKGKTFGRQKEPIQKDTPGGVMDRHGLPSRVFSFTRHSAINASNYLRKKEEYSSARALNTPPT